MRNAKAESQRTSRCNRGNGIVTSVERIKECVRHHPQATWRSMPRASRDIVFLGKLFRKPPFRISITFIRLVQSSKQAVRPRSARPVQPTENVSYGVSVSRYMRRMAYVAPSRFRQRRSTLPPAESQSRCSTERCRRYLRDSDL